MLFSRLQKLFYSDAPKTSKISKISLMNLPELTLPSQKWLCIVLNLDIYGGFENEMKRLFGSHDTGNIAKHGIALCCQRNEDSSPRNWHWRYIRHDGSGKLCVDRHMSQL